MTQHLMTGGESARLQIVTFSLSSRNWQSLKWSFLMQRSRHSSALVLAVFLFVAAWFQPEARAQPLQGAPSQLVKRDVDGVTAAECRIGLDFALALADPTVARVLLMNDVTLTASDFSARIHLERNVTIIGIFPERHQWPILDLGFVKDVVALSSGRMLNFSQLIFNNARKDPHFQAIGMDLIVFSPRDASQPYALVVGWHMATVQRTCLPDSMAGISTTSLKRPDELPAQQRSTRTPQWFPCTNDTSARPMDRCWIKMGTYIDIALYCSDLIGPAKSLVLNNYIMWTYDVLYMCPTIMSEECTKENGGPLGCYYKMFPDAVSNGTAVASDSGGDGDGDKQQRLLAIILPSVLLGSLVLVVAVGAVVYWNLRRLRRSCSSDTFTCDADKPEAAAAQVAIRMASAQQMAACAPRGVGNSKGGGAAEERSDSSGAGADPPPHSEEADQFGLCYHGNDGMQAPITPQTPFLPVVELGVKLNDQQPSPAAKWGASNAALTAAAASSREQDSHSVGGSVDGSLSTRNAEVRLLTKEVLGAGTFGRVVVGVYNGQRVAVKLVNRGLAADVPQPGKPLWKPSAGGKHGLSSGDAAGGASASTDCGGGGGAASKGRPLESFSVEAKALAQEVEVLARCQHPNIVRLLAACLEPPQFCLVMELMDTSLEKLIHRKINDSKVPLPLPMVLNLGMQIAKALSYMHPTILHRDLKPGNVLISQPDSPKPLAKLADFGLSRLLNTVLITRNPEVGTAPYMAPETFDIKNDGTITDRADMYSFGVIMWEMLAGERPWAGMSMFQIAMLITMAGKHLPVERLSKERCPRKLQALILSCWDPDPARRPAAVEAVKILAMLQQ